MILLLSCRFVNRWRGKNAVCGD